MNLRQQADARPLLQMPAQGRAADLISGRFQTAPWRALSEKLTQGRQHPNRRRSGMAATLLRRGRAEIDNCRDEVQKPKAHPGFRGAGGGVRGVRPSDPCSMADYGFPRWRLVAAMAG